MPFKTDFEYHNTVFFIPILAVVNCFQAKSSLDQRLDLYITFRTAWCKMLSDALKSYISCYDGSWFCSTRQSVPLLLCCLKWETPLKASFIIKNNSNSPFWVRKWLQQNSKLLLWYTTTWKHYKKGYMKHIKLPKWCAAYIK